MNFLDGCIMQSSLFCLEDRRAANHDFVIVTGTEHARWLHNETGPFRTQSFDDTRSFSLAVFNLKSKGI